MLAIRRHYDHNARQLECTLPLDASSLQPPLVIVPVQDWNKVVQSALRFALTISPEIYAVHVAFEDEQGELQKEWPKFVEAPVRLAGQPAPKLVILPSPYRFVITPIVGYVMDMARATPQRRIAVVVPQTIESRWYFRFLQNHRAEVLKALLQLRGNARIAIISAPWHLEE